MPTVCRKESKAAASSKRAGHSLKKSPFFSTILSIVVKLAAVELHRLLDKMASAANARCKPVAISIEKERLSLLKPQVNYKMCKTTA